jgi:electron transfer flavoprotein alpha subunit
MQNSLNNDVWVYIDLRTQRLFNACLNVIAAAQQLAGPFGGQVVALILTDGEDGPKTNAGGEPSGVDVAAAMETCGAKGADKICIITHAALADTRADTQAEALNRVVHQKSPRVVLFALSDLGREIAAFCARQANAGLIADCVGFEVDKDQIMADCPSWGGEIMARLSFADSTQTGFVTVSAHAFSPLDTKKNDAVIEKIELHDLIPSNRLKRISSATEALEHLKLENAKTVVVGGAGVRTAEGFAGVRRLAAAMGAEVGATRPPVLRHWIDEERLIGQTGKSVRPKLLVSIGTSGAVQYTAGIVESETIVAINRDPDAPIFQTADIGIVADAKDLVPLVESRIKQVVMRDLADQLCVDKTDAAENGFGEKICKLRESHNWSIEELADQTGQTPEAIDKFERNQSTPSVSFLLRLSKALGVDPGTFLSEDEKADILDQRAKAFIKRTKNYHYQTLTPGGENQHLRGFMITIEPRQAHKPVAYKHEGEEFVFVMEGSLELTLGNKVKQLKTGESIWYNSETSHKLKNRGNEVTRCLVMLFTP